MAVGAVYSSVTCTMPPPSGCLAQAEPGSYRNTSLSQYNESRLPLKSRAGALGDFLSSLSPSAGRLCFGSHHM